MEFQLRLRSAERTIDFSVNPEEITVRTDTQSQSYSVLELGEISLSRGRKATRYSWSGMLPGEGRLGQPMAEGWRTPREILADLDFWQKQNTRLQLILAGTDINQEVYIESLEHSWKGGHGDLWYKIQLVESRPLLVRIDGEVPTGAAGTVAETGRTDPAPPSTYTVKSGDSLWAIAKMVYGDGSRWQEIYQANVGLVGSDPDLIQSGQELRIPGGESGGT